MEMYVYVCKSYFMRVMRRYIIVLHLNEMRILCLCWTGTMCLNLNTFTLFFLFQVLTDTKATSTLRGQQHSYVHRHCSHTDFTENTLKHSSTRVLTLWSNTLSIREKLESNVQPLGPIVLSSTPSVLCCVACIVQRSRGCKLILKTEYQTACLIQFVCSVRVIHTLLIDDVEMVVKRQFLLWYILFFLLLIFYDKRIALLCILYGCVSCVIVKYY